MKMIKNFIQAELDYYIKRCNFTEEELSWFTMKSKDWSDVKMSLALGVSVSKVNKLSKKVRDKMKRVDEFYGKNNIDNNDDEN